MTKVGTTFSTLQCQYLDIDFKETFQETLGLGFGVVRVCCYWNEIEAKEGEFDFEVMDWLLEEAEKAGVEVVLAVGMKSPRYPEFHLPKWVEEKYKTEGIDRLDKVEGLREKALRFIEAMIRHTYNRSCIKYYQVENEALKGEAVSRGRYLGFEFLKEEVKLVRNLKREGQKILLTNSIDLWPIHSREDAQKFEQSLDLADTVGINVYTTVPTSPNKYLSPTFWYWQKLKRWQKKLKKEAKEAWIAELQAEPWEHGSAVHLEVQNYPSASPERTKKTFKKLTEMGYEVVLLWGCEYWYFCKARGREDWWEMAKSLNYFSP